MLRWINSALFTVGQIFMSVLMMCKLRKEFDDFYAEYGCFLRTVVTIQAISLLILTTIESLIRQSEAVNSFVLK